MIYILLAAGSGTRMGVLASDRSKVLVEVEGRTILEHNLRAILAVEPSADIWIVSGYRAESVIAFVSGVPEWANVRVVPNSRYKLNGPLRSIEIALHALPSSADAITIGNGDTIFLRDALASLRCEGSPVTMLGSFPVPSDEDDVQLIIGPERVEVAAKRLGPQGSLPVSAGLIQFLGREAIWCLEEAVISGLEEEDRTNRSLTWHSVIARIADLKPQVRMVPRDWWWEFDTPESLIRYNRGQAGRRLSG